MSTDNLIIEHLKAMRGEVAAVKADTSDIRQHLRSLDTSVIDLRRSVVHLYEDTAHQQLTMDKMLDRIQRIEKRLELS
jgi:chromosome segregation ATPase